MSELVERFIIPLNSIGYELRPSATMRGMARTVKKQTNKVMGWDIDTLKKEIAVMTEKLSQKKKKLQHLQEQTTRTSKTAIAYHAAKHFFKSAIGTKKSDATHASDVDHSDLSPERYKAEDAVVDGGEQKKTVPDKYNPASETSEQKGKGGMPTPKSGHPMPGNWLQRAKGKGGKLFKTPKGNPDHALQTPKGKASSRFATPGGHAHKALTKPKAKAGNWFKMPKGKAASWFKPKKKK